MSRIDISQLTEAICRRLDLDPGYVARLDLDAGSGTARVTLYKGRDGRCAGAKYIDDTGDAAMEELTVSVIV